MLFLMLWRHHLRAYSEVPAVGLVYDRGLWVIDQACRGTIAEAHPFAGVASYDWTGFRQMHLRLSRTYFFAIVAGAIAIGGLYYVLHQASGRLVKPTESAGDYSVVIGGDSLSFNAFEFDSTAPLLPADYAYKNPYGLASWGHMVRDRAGFPTRRLTELSAHTWNNDA